MEMIHIKLQLFNNWQQFAKSYKKWKFPENPQKTAYDREVNQLNLHLFVASWL